jgi:hypothetical protein
MREILFEITLDPSREELNYNAILISWVSDILPSLEQYL